MKWHPHQQTLSVCFHISLSQLQTVRNLLASCYERYKQRKAYLSSHFLTYSVHCMYYNCFLSCTQLQNVYSSVPEWWWYWTRYTSLCLLCTDAWGIWQRTTVAIRTTSHCNTTRWAIWVLHNATLLKSIRDGNYVEMFTYVGSPGQLTHILQLIMILAW